MRNAPSTEPEHHADEQLADVARELLDGIARGERAVADGRTLDHAEARRRMSRWLDR